MKTLMHVENQRTVIDVNLIGLIVERKQEPFVAYEILNLPDDEAGTRTTKVWLTQRDYADIDDLQGCSPEGMRNPLNLLLLGGL